MTLNVDSMGTEMKFCLFRSSCVQNLGVSCIRFTLCRQTPSKLQAGRFQITAVHAQAEETDSVGKHETSTKAICRQCQTGLFMRDSCTYLECRILFFDQIVCTHVERQRQASNTPVLPIDPVHTFRFIPVFCRSAVRKLKIRRPTMCKQASR